MGTPAGLQVPVPVAAAQGSLANLRLPSPLRLVSGFAVPAGALRLAFHHSRRKTLRGAVEPPRTPDPPPATPPSIAARSPAAGRGWCQPSPGPRRAGTRA